MEIRTEQTDSKKCAEKAADAFDRFDETGNYGYLTRVIQWAERALDFDPDNGNASALIDAAEQVAYFS